jgi:hypothetical protein
MGRRTGLISYPVVGDCIIRYHALRIRCHWAKLEVSTTVRSAAAPIKDEGFL